ncbi:hypothetical protein ACFQBQ_09085 [Granulicella cerasi]|uniref:Uncharacterized protein n=1 Tax=Granulicella cerasi TaxID=741063 RepID=A0ABW1Z9D4_9BACT|nr:hypothetical protein [Granulicella cerasi]
MSKSNEEAMQQNDQHGVANAKSSKSVVHEHTKPAGDLRDVADKEDSHSAFRGEATRGH